MRYFTIHLPYKTYVCLYDFNKTVAKFARLVNFIYLCFSLLLL